MDSDDDIILAFVRGEGDWRDLTLLGAEIELDGSGLVLREPSGLPVVRVSAADVACGLLGHWRRSTGLQDWARVLLATDTVDLSVFEDSPSQEILLEAVWDAAGGDDPPQAAIALAESLE